MCETPLDWTQHSLKVVLGRGAGVTHGGLMASLPSCVSRTVPSWWMAPGSASSRKGPRTPWY